MAAATNQILNAQYPTVEFFETPLGPFGLWTGNNPTEKVNGIWVRQYCVICRQLRYPNWDTLDRVRKSSTRFHCDNENCNRALMTITLIPGRLYKNGSREEKDLIDRLHFQLSGHPEEDRST